MTTLPAICLEDDCEASWDDAKTRLKVAAEVFVFPFFITLDETAYAYDSFDDYLAERGMEDPAEIEAARQWWNVHAIEVHNFPDALAALYPWFHDGEAMPVRIKLEGAIGGWQ